MQKQNGYSSLIQATVFALVALIPFNQLSAETAPQQYDLFPGDSAVDSGELDEVVRREVARVVGERIKRYSHEPSSFGYTIDGNDENFLDIKISFKYSPFDNGLSRLDRPDKTASWRWNLPYFYFAFSMRQAFYVETERESNPVIGQRFNPEMFARYWLKDGGYLDFGYNHESNGQSISSAEEFVAKKNDFSTNGKPVTLADEFISRGWDYWELTYKNNLSVRKYGYEGLSYYLILRRFLSEGLLQDGVEEVNSWETDRQLLKRSEVDGLVLRFKWSDRFNRNKYLRKASYEFTSGIDNLLHRNSSRVELGLDLGLPITLWISEGYNDDLVDYYRRVRSIGINLVELHGF